MAISLYFGLPGCGKTTWLTKLALDAIREGAYQYVYTNVHLNVPGVTIIDNDCIGKYELENCLLLIDEATLFADSRDFKNFSKGRLEYFLEHRHRCADIVLFTQQWDGVDRKIRVITDRVYYVYKGPILGRWLSCCWRVPYGILFPDPKKSGEKLGEIVQGYSKPNFFVRLFAKRIFRPLYYKYFDSWELEKLPALPSDYQPITTDFYTAPVFMNWIHARKRLFRRTRRARKADYRVKAKERRTLFRSKFTSYHPVQRIRKSGKYCEDCRGAATSV